MPTVVWTHYLLYILTTGTLGKPHFFTPRSKQNAWCLGYRPGAAKWRPWGRKMTRVGSPGNTKGAKGAPNASQNAPQNRPKSAPLSRTASKGAFRVPWVPQRLQNTSISDVPPTDVTPRRGNVHLLSAIPHSLAPSHCEASLERGGLGVCPLELPQFRV